MNHESEAAQAAAAAEGVEVQWGQQDGSSGRQQQAVRRVRVRVSGLTSDARSEAAADGAASKN